MRLTFAPLEVILTKMTSLLKTFYLMQELLQSHHTTGNGVWLLRCYPNRHKTFQELVVHVVQTFALTGTDGTFSTVYCKMKEEARL